MKQKKRILVSEFQKLLTSVLQHDDVAIVERVADLEGVYGISAPGNNLIMNLSGCEPVLIKAVTEFDISDVSHAASAHQIITLLQNAFHLRMLG